MLTIIAGNLYISKSTVHQTHFVFFLSSRIEESLNAFHLCVVFFSENKTRSEGEKRPLLAEHHVEMINRNLDLFIKFTDFVFI